MTQTMDLKKLGLSPMTTSETEEINGGFWWAVLAAAIISIADNFGDIRHGISDGYNGVPPRHN